MRVLYIREVKGGRQLTHDVKPQQNFQFHGYFCRSSPSTCLTGAVCDPRSLSVVVVASDASLRMSLERLLSLSPLQQQQEHQQPGRRLCERVHPESDDGGSIILRS
ncbi:hypothetical protein ALC62_08184 [Cyphomyrmex costatus]|uniref:Uncharacterized protein n=1 Tax=Cyphomyrmex costatus TaxID=456900 RepID=A0A195CJR7_9HYME|nr:hypothetical protein ALC62_08184 [Cyphomyrmex costatus]